MTARLEWLPHDAPLTLLAAGEKAHDGQQLDGAPLGVIIGHDDGAVVLGSREELVAFGRRWLDLLAAASELTPEEQRLLEEAEAEAYGPIE